MIRNFVAGIVWGGVAGAMGLAVVSQLAPAPSPIAANSNPQVVDQAAATTASGDRGPVVTSHDAAAIAPQTQPPALEAAPAAIPEAVADQTTQTKTAGSTEYAPVADGVAAAPPVDSTAIGALEVLPQPVPATEVNSAAAPAPPPAPEPPSGLNEDAPKAPDDLTTKVVPPAIAAAGDAAPGVAIRPGELPVTSGGDAAPSAAQLPSPAPVVAPETMLTPAPDLQKDAAPAQIALEPAGEAAATPQPETPLIPSVEPQTPAAAGLAENALPQIGDTPPAVAAASEPAGQFDDRPVVAFARSFSNPNSKPEFVVVLRDTGAAELDRAALAALPFPISFAIDPSDPDATAHAAIYRAAGQEVVMLAGGIPQDATAADLEQTFQANAALLPETVAVMDKAVAGFQDDRMLAAQVVSVIGAQGRGVLTFDRGLNAAHQVARREEVPAAVVFRDLDAEGEDAQKIRRYLDRAAFKAAQEGYVVVAGSTRPETIAALVEWAVEGRASLVEMAPLTAVLSQP